jgi:hypothetical protein
VGIEGVNDRPYIGVPRHDVERPISATAIEDDDLREPLERIERAADIWRLVVGED